MKTFTSLAIVWLFFQQTQAQVFTEFPENIEPDSANAPFYHGVASGDPLTDGIILWTRVSPPDVSSNISITVDWEIATDEQFADVVQSGQFVTDSLRDWTVKVDVAGLESGSTYFYRFAHDGNDYSMIGRTKTLPSGSVDELRLGVSSCANIFHGFFNAYGAMAQRDLDAVIFLGDFIYNNDGSNSQIRWPVPDPWQITNNNTKRDWYDRHSYYHYDVDFRELLATHPAIIMWDNHDVHRSFYEPAVEAWLDWVPVREDPVNSIKIYRQLVFGDLVNLNMLDVSAFEDVDSIGPDEDLFLGQEQFDWAKDRLLQSTTIWNLVGQQKNFTTWSVGPIIGPIIGAENNEIGDKNWSSRPLSRQLFKDFLKDNEIPNFMILSGDAHVANVADIDHDIDNNSDYNGNTGEGSIGVEFLPTGITSSNMDERVLPAWVQDALVSTSLDINDHQIYANLVDHGYGVLQINRDSIVASICFMDVTVDTDNESCESFVVYNGTNHWKRDGQTYQPSSVRNSITGLTSFEVYPNPTKGEVTLSIDAQRVGEVDLFLYTVDGKLAQQFGSRNVIVGKNQFDLDFSSISTGQYFIQVEQDGRRAFKKLIVIE